MKPVWYNYEAEEYDLDNACNEDDDRRTDTRGTSVYTTYGQWSAEVPDTSVWYDWSPLPLPPPLRRTAPQCAFFFI